MYGQEKEKSSPICPRTGKILKSPVKNRWARWLFPVTGLIATIWFLARVIPKPSRAEYPCQRVAFPLASSFIAYTVGIFATAVAFRKARQRLSQSRYVLAAVCILVSIASAWFTISINSRKAKAYSFTPPDPPNSPMGVAKGIYPGRVVWVHDPNATNWNGPTDLYYWDDDHTDQNAVDQMMSTALRWLTGEPNDEAAWDALFRYFNQTHGRGNVGYQAGEKIIIKPNHVDQRMHPDLDNNVDVAPQVELSLLKQLVYKAGVDQNCITICDPTRFIADKTYDKCNDVFPDVAYEETNIDKYQQYNPGTAGRVKVVPSDSNLIYYSGDPGAAEPKNYDRFPTSFTNATYMINLAILKSYQNAGVTLCGKNLYGSRSDGDPNVLHKSLPYKNSSLGQYRAIVDLMGHRDIGGKTLLYLLDGLWGCKKHPEPPVLWSMPPFNGDYPSSLFASQDPGAIDSVGLDFARTQWREEWSTACGNSVDDYLHEAALANDPPSGTFYGPDYPIGNPNRTRLQSLGVHEHWNDANDKLYTRNLGTGDGIELVSAYTWTCTELLAGDVTVDCKVDEEDLATMASN